MILNIKKTAILILTIALLMLAPCALLACEKPRIPVEVINKTIIDYSNQQATLFYIFAPIQFQDWQLTGAAYHQGKNRIPIQKNTMTQSDTSVGVFHLSVTTDSLKTGNVYIRYHPSASAYKNNGRLIQPCIIVQKVDFDIQQNETASPH